MRDGVALQTAGKAVRKPLELLAAHGGGPVDADALINALWPSLDSQAPGASLEMTVSRLRNWLDMPEAVQIAADTVWLHPALVWTDVGAFEAACEAPAGAERALALYRALMRLQLARGERAGALLTCRRCRERLAAELSAAPAAETEALRRRVEQA